MAAKKAKHAQGLNSFNCNKTSLVTKYNTVLFQFSKWNYIYCFDFLFPGNGAFFWYYPGIIVIKILNIKARIRRVKLSASQWNQTKILNMYNKWWETR